MTPPLTSRDPWEDGVGLAYWALALPALLIFVVSTYGAVYGALALACNPPLTALSSAWDERGVVATSSGDGDSVDTPRSIPRFEDVPIAELSEAIYGGGHGVNVRPRVRGKGELR